MNSYVLELFRPLGRLFGYPPRPRYKRARMTGTVLVVQADGKRHRVDPVTGTVVGPVARKRIASEVRRQKKAAPSFPIDQPTPQTYA